MGELRAVIARARRIVVKIGSSSLTGADGRLSEDAVVRLADASGDGPRRDENDLASAERSR